MVEAYWLMEKRIVEEQQQGKERADNHTLDRQRYQHTCAAGISGIHADIP